MRFVAVTPRLTPKAPAAATNRAAAPRRATPPRYRPQPAGRFPSESDGHKKMTVTQRIVVTGRVQGIGYRTWTMGAARDLGVRGWVRNSNGSGIEILATGDDEAMAILVQACHRGPRLARVENVDVEPAEDAGWKGFSKRFAG